MPASDATLDELGTQRDLAKLYRNLAMRMVRIAKRSGVTDAQISEEILFARMSYPKASQRINDDIEFTRLFRGR